MAASTPQVSFSDVLHRYIFKEESVEFSLERFDQGRNGEIKAEMRVDYLGKMIRPPSTINLLAERTVESAAKLLANRAGGDSSIDFSAMLMLITAKSVERYRGGLPPVDLTTVSGWRERPRYMLWPYVEASGDTVMFADGGSGKSTLALIMAVCVATGVTLLPECRVDQTGNVLYLDWEADEQDHAERLAAIRAGVDPYLEIPEGAIMYKRMTASLSESVEELRKHIAQNQIKLVVIDSIGRARSGGGVESSEDTIKLFNAIRRLGTPTLCIDHMSKEGVFTERGGTRPIGSTYTHNNARLTWSVTAGDSRMDEITDDDTSSMHTVQLTNHKNNNGKLNRRRTYSLQYFTDDHDRLQSIFVQPIDPSTVPAFLKLLPLWQRCRALLQEHVGADSAQLAEWTGAKRAEVERNLAGQPGTFYLASDDRWYLVAQNANVGQSEMDWYQGLGG